MMESKDFSSQREALIKSVRTQLQSMILLRLSCLELKDVTIRMLKMCNKIILLLLLPILLS